MSEPETATARTSTNKPRNIRCVKKLKKAIEKVILEKMTIRAASLYYEEPERTICQLVRKLRLGEEVLLMPSSSFRKTFNEEYEEALILHMQDMAKAGTPLCKREFLKLAYNLAEHLKIPHRFNKTKQSAGYQFYVEFVKRHPEVGIDIPKKKPKKPKPTHSTYSDWPSKQDLEEFSDYSVDFDEKQKRSQKRTTSSDDDTDSQLYQVMDIFDFI